MKQSVADRRISAENVGKSGRLHCLVVTGCTTNRVTTQRWVGVQDGRDRRIHGWADGGCRRADGRAGPRADCADRGATDPRTGGWPLATRGRPRGRTRGRRGHGQGCDGLRGQRRDGRCGRRGQPRTVS
jgi:hypothetical protein